MVQATQTNQLNKTPPPSRLATTRTPSRNVARAANCRASARLSAPTRHQQHAAADTLLAVARLRVDEAPRRAGEEHQPVGEEHLPVRGATMQPVQGGAMVKRRRTRRAVRAGHRKIVVARRALARAATIRAVATAAQATALPGRARPVVTLARPVRRVRGAHPAQGVAKAIAVRHRLVAAAAMAVTAAAATVAITVAEPVRVAVDRAMAVGAARAAMAVKVMAAHPARDGVSVVSRLRAAADIAAAETAVAMRAAASAMTVARLLRVQLTPAVVMRAAQTVHRVPVAQAVAAAGPIAMA